MKKKKILHIVEAFGGGVFTYLSDLCNALVSIYDITIAYSIRAQTPENFKQYFDSRIQFIYVENFQRSLNPFKDLKAIKELKKITTKVKPDIIHLHSSKAGVLGRIAINGKSTPLFYTPHGYSFLMMDQKKIKRDVYRMIERIFARFPCTIISCSEGEHKETLKLTHQAVYVNNGICLDSLEKQLSGLRKKTTTHSFTVFTLGRVSYQKNPALFNQIAEQLPNIHFVWIGDGELKEQLSASNIELTGWLNRESALKKAFSSDVFILTSLWEGLPISLLEAMFMKKLCVVSDVIGNHDVIHHGVNGFVCHTAEEFATCIRKAQEKNGLTALVEKAYSEISREYNTDCMAKKYHQIYMGETNE